MLPRTISIGKQSAAGAKNAQGVITSSVLPMKRLQQIRAGGGQRQALRSHRTGNLNPQTAPPSTCPNTHTSSRCDGLEGRKPLLAFQHDACRRRLLVTKGFEGFHTFAECSGAFSSGVYDGFWTCLGSTTKATMACWLNPVKNG